MSDWGTNVRSQTKKERSCCDKFTEVRMKSSRAEQPPFLYISGCSGRHSHPVYEWAVSSNV